jgi:hypothetical protein
MPFSLSLLPPHRLIVMNLPENGFRQLRLTPGGGAGPPAIATPAVEAEAETLARQATLRRPSFRAINTPVHAQREVFTNPSSQKQAVAKFLDATENTGNEIIVHTIRGQKAGCAVGTASDSAHTKKNKRKSATNAIAPTRMGVISLRTFDIRFSAPKRITEI